MTVHDPRAVEYDRARREGPAQRRSESVRPFCDWMAERCNAALEAGTNPRIREHMMRALLGQRLPLETITAAFSATEDEIAHVTRKVAA